jgi:hypothetical protein
MLNGKVIFLRGESSINSKNSIIKNLFNHTNISSKNDAIKIIRGLYV